MKHWKSDVVSKIKKFCNFEKLGGRPIEMLKFKIWFLFKRMTLSYEYILMGKLGKVVYESDIFEK